MIFDLYSLEKPDFYPDQLQALLGKAKVFNRLVFLGLFISNAIGIHSQLQMKYLYYLTKEKILISKSMYLYTYN